MCVFCVSSFCVRSMESQKGHFHSLRLGFWFSYSCFMVVDLSLCVMFYFSFPVFVCFLFLIALLVSSASNLYSLPCVFNYLSFPSLLCQSICFIPSVSVLLLLFLDSCPCSLSFWFVLILFSFISLWSFFGFAAACFCLFCCSHFGLCY